MTRSSHRRVLGEVQFVIRAQAQLSFASSCASPPLWREVLLLAEPMIRLSHEADAMLSFPHKVRKLPRLRSVCPHPQQVGRHPGSFSCAPVHPVVTVSSLI